jgi:hypothetical protein
MYGVQAQLTAPGVTEWLYVRSTGISPVPLNYRALIVSECPASSAALTAHLSWD